MSLDGYGDDFACRCFIRAVAGKGGVVGACAGGGPARVEGDLAARVGGLGSVVVADAVEVVVDLDGLRGEGRCAALEGCGEGVGLVDGGGKGAGREREFGGCGDGERRGSCTHGDDSCK